MTFKKSIPFIFLLLGLMAGWALARWQAPKISPTASVTPSDPESPIKATETCIQSKQGDQILFEGINFAPDSFLNHLITRFLGLSPAEITQIKEPKAYAQALTKLLISPFSPLPNQAQFNIALSESITRDNQPLNIKTHFYWRNQKRLFLTFPTAQLSESVLLMVQDSISGELLHFKRYRIDHTLERQSIWLQFDWHISSYQLSVHQTLTLDPLAVMRFGFERHRKP